MLRVLTLSSLFPDAARPTFGGFVAKQTMALAAHPDVTLQVVAPLGLPPWPLSRHARYAALAALPPRETWQGLTVHRPRFPIVPAIGGPLSPRLMARALLPLLRRIRRDFPFDVIDAEFFYPDGPAAVALGRALRVPVSIKARGSDIHYWSERPGCRRQIVAAGRAADGLLAVSGPLRQDMIALGMPADRIRVHHTGVDPGLFHPRDRAAEKAALGVAGPLLVSIGYLIERKGQRLAIEAIPAIPGATLLIVGDGPAKAELEAGIAALGLGDRVRMLGPLPHAALPPLLAAADIMVLPSSSEGLANVWVEALACGTPVITADVGGAREVVNRPAAGRLVPLDPAAIAAAANGILRDPPAVAEVLAAVAGFTWEANTAALHAHLDRLRAG
ncbi:glycosyltransferase [Sphingomonas profundi]|uniref:glycosyltransferase n=1 Tax=Alterirhizorhabdus profundi TaxID=2681549 RepID=UPI0012E92DC3|nr:glycosyltransferase [Sphingomonas profundi]